MMAASDLQILFDELNLRFFAGTLARPVLRWNSRLRTSAGRFIPGRHGFFLEKAAQIEVASYLLKEEGAPSHVVDTLGHEMIHYWLWCRNRPYGHTAEFYAKMKEMGVSRYNPVPKRRPFKYLYECLNCRQKFPARRKLGALACAHCCKRYARGRFDRRFQLVFVQAWDSPI